LPGGIGMTSSIPPDLTAMSGIRSILIVRLKAMGDIVLSLPVVSAMRESFPHARISYLCRGAYAEALGGDTGIDEVLELPEGIVGQISLIMKLRRRRIDLALDLLSSPRSALLARLSRARIRIGMDVGRHNWFYHYVLPRAVVRGGKRVKVYTLEANIEITRQLGLEYRSRPGKPTYEIGFPAAEAERQWAEDYMGNSGMDPSKIVGIAPVATYQSKSWPAESFAGLARIMVDELGLCPVVIWGPGERDTAEYIVSRVNGAVMIPEVGIARLGALIGRLRLLVSLDSGPKHLAVIQGVPTVTLFGPTDPLVWNPSSGNHRAVHRSLDCSPCHKLGCDPNICMTQISPGEVADEVAGLLGLERMPDR